MWMFPQDFSSLIMSRSLLCADLPQALLILDTLVHGKSTNIGGDFTFHVSTYIPKLLVKLA